MKNLLTTLYSFRNIEITSDSSTKGILPLLAATGVWNEELSELESQIVAFQIPLSFDYIALLFTLIHTDRVALPIALDATREEVDRILLEWCADVIVQVSSSESADKKRLIIQPLATGSTNPEPRHGLVAISDLVTSEPERQFYRWQELVSELSLDLRQARSSAPTRLNARPNRKDILKLLSACVRGETLLVDD